MPDNETAAQPASIEQVQQSWPELTLRVAELEAERDLLRGEIKSLRAFLNRVIDYRQRSHNELVLILTNLVSKLPMTDLGIVVAKLVEHNTGVAQTLAGFLGGTAEMSMAQPEVLKTLEQTRRDLAAAVKTTSEELAGLNCPFDPALLKGLPENPDLFFSPNFVRANRCFVKGYLPRERVVAEFGPEALVLFDDLTTDPKLNRRPKPEEIVLGFKSDFEARLPEQTPLPAERRAALLELYQRVQRSKAATEESRRQRTAFLRLSFVIELLHFYENQATEAPDVLFAQRLPGLIEQLALSGSEEKLEEKWLAAAEQLLAHIIAPEHRLMVINNIGKSSESGKTLKFILRLRQPVTMAELDQILPEFIKHLVPTPPQKPPTAAALAALLKLLRPEGQRAVLKWLVHCERLRRDQAEALCKETGSLLGLENVLQQLKTPEEDSPQLERQRAWAKIKDLIAKRGSAADIANALRERLNAKYDADEIRESWLVLTEADSIALIRVFCALPYLPSGKTDAVARPVLDAYVHRLTHPKYATVYNKVLTSLRTMHTARPDNPTVLNFLALVRWVNTEAADKISSEIGMAAPAAHAA